MKIRPHDADRFLAKPSPDIQAVLIYGPDLGLVRERSRNLAQTHLGKPDQDLGLVDLTESDLKTDPARLADEISAMSMLSDKRVVRVQEAGEIAGRIVGDLLKGLEDGSVVAEAALIIEAGNLTPRSKLRSLFEKGQNVAAIACYADEGRALQDVIASTLSKADLRVQPAAIQMLLSRLGRDRGLTRGELEKLLLFKGVGTETFSAGEVSVDDVEASLGLGEEADIDTVIDAALAGDFDRLDRALTTALADGKPAAMILRAAGNHLGRLHFVRTQMDTGSNSSDLMKSLRPPVFFKRQPAFAAQVNLWNATALRRAIHVALKAEMDCRKTGAPDVAICAHALMALASNARRRSRGRA